MQNKTIPLSLFLIESIGKQYIEEMNSIFGIFME